MDFCAVGVNGFLYCYFDGQELGVSVCSANPTFWNEQLPQNSAQLTISCQTSMCMEAYACSVWQRRHFEGQYFHSGILIVGYFLTPPRLGAFVENLRHVYIKLLNMKQEAASGAKHGSIRGIVLVFANTTTSPIIGLSRVFWHGGHCAMLKRNTILNRLYVISTFETLTIVIL
jgi:hypothetical protein